VAGGTSGQALNTVWGSSYSSTGTSGACVGTLPAYVTPCGSTFSADSVGTGNGATLTFSATLTHLTVDKFALGLFVSGALVGGDIGNGTIIGPNLSGTNTINYATGAVTITFSGGHAPANTAPITASYIANGWGNSGTGLLDEDCRAGHSSYCGAPNTACGGKDCYAIYCVPRRHWSPASPRTSRLTSTPTPKTLRPITAQRLGLPSKHGRQRLLRRSLARFLISVPFYSAHGAPRLTNT